MNRFRHFFLAATFLLLVSCVPGAVLLTNTSCVPWAQGSEYRLDFYPDDLRVFPGGSATFDISLERIREDAAMIRGPFELTAAPSFYIDVELPSQIRLDGEPVRVRLTTDRSISTEQHYFVFQAARGDLIVPGCISVTVRAS